MRPEDVAHWRLRTVGLSPRRFSSPEDVVRSLLAVQSQDYGPAKWSLGQRSRSATDAGLDRAFADGVVLRTHVLRPTWHFVLPDDIRWLLELTAPRVQALNAPYYRRVGLDETVRARTVSLIVDALRGGRQLTRAQVGDVLREGGVEADGFKLGYVLMNAELEGVVCSGALAGKQHTYALLDERAPRARGGLRRDEALAELALRFFAGHGPATEKDLRIWATMTAADVRLGLAHASEQLEHEVVDGKTYWFAEPRPRRRAASPTVHLLQAYDEYVMGYGETKRVVDAAGLVAPDPPGRPVFLHLLILDGQLVGRWKRTIGKGSVLIEVSLYAPLDAGQTDALRTAADRHGAFLGLPATVSVVASP